jgi:hypothetical protein
MLSLPVITADSNARRHPRNEAIKPVIPNEFQRSLPASAKSGSFAFSDLSLIANNSQWQQEVGHYDSMTPLRDVGATSAVASSMR